MDKGLPLVLMKDFLVRGRHALRCGSARHSQNALSALFAATQLLLLIEWRLAHAVVCSQKHASMFLVNRQCMAELGMKNVNFSNDVECLVC